MPATDAQGPDSIPPELARYSRQILYPQVGLAGQRRLRHASVALIGCGALGSALANMLVRAGVGGLRIIDRDFIETNNLQRQTLFDEQDIAANLPKAEAAARKLRRINSAVEIEGHRRGPHAAEHRRPLRAGRPAAGRQRQHGDALPGQ